MVDRQTPERGVRSLLSSPCCVLEQDTFTSQNVLVIPRKRWLRPDMTEKLFTGMLSKYVTSACDLCHTFCQSLLTIIAQGVAALEKKKGKNILNS